MDQQQLELALEITALDCTLTGRLKDGAGNFCAIGGLYAVIDPDWAIQQPVQDEDTQGMYDGVRDAFDLEPGGVISANDDSLTIPNQRDVDIEARRERVARELRQQASQS